MKRKHALALILALFTLLATGCAAQKDGQTTIVTSFYPMYVLTLNVTDGVDGVTVQNMAEQNVGCLHDYQLQTRDMVTLEGADALVINGGGMEQFMDKVISLRADLPVIDAGEGIEMFPSDEEHDHDAHGHDDHDELYNAHVWLDPNRAMIQVQNIAAGLAEADPEHAEAYQKNAESYIARLTALNAELAEQLAPFAGAEIITFHVECDDDIDETITEIEKYGVKPALSLKPGTPVECLYPYLDRLYMVLVMTVEPGFGGQKFMADQMEKLRALRAKRPELILEVDGGVNRETAPICRENGADVAVAGTAVFRAENIPAEIALLRGE